MSDTFRVISRALHYTSKVSASIRHYLLFYPLVHLDKETQEKYTQTKTIPSNSELVDRLKELNLDYIVFMFAVYKGRYFLFPIRVSESPELRNQIAPFATHLYEFKHDESLRRRTSIINIEEILQLSDEGPAGHIQSSAIITSPIITSFLAKTRNILENWQNFERNEGFFYSIFS